MKMFLFFFSSRRRHTRSYGDWSSDVCSSDLTSLAGGRGLWRLMRGRLGTGTERVVESHLQGSPFYPQSLARNPLGTGRPRGVIRDLPLERECADSGQEAGDRCAEPERGLGTGEQEAPEHRADHEADLPGNRA